jgi:hypothetical protein
MGSLVERSSLPGKALNWTGRAHAKCSAPSGGGLTRKNQGPRCPPPRLLGPVLLGFPWKPANVYLPGSTMHPWRCIHNGTKVTARIPRTCRNGCPPNCNSRNPLRPLSPSRLAGRSFSSTAETVADERYGSESWTSNSGQPRVPGRSRSRFASKQQHYRFTPGRFVARSFVNR